jgi:hypothetical protein
MSVEFESYFVSQLNTLEGDEWRVYDVVTRPHGVPGIFHCFFVSPQVKNILNKIISNIPNMNKCSDEAKQITYIIHKLICFGSIEMEKQPPYTSTLTIATGGLFITPLHIQEVRLELDSNQIRLVDKKDVLPKLIVYPTHKEIKSCSPLPMSIEDYLRYTETRFERNKYFVNPHNLCPKIW